MERSVEPSGNVHRHMFRHKVSQSSRYLLVVFRVRFPCHCQCRVLAGLQEAHKDTKHETRKSVQTPIPVRTAKHFKSTGDRNEKICLLDLIELMVAEHGRH